MRPLLRLLPLLALLAAVPAEARFRVCAFSFNTPDELNVFRARLPQENFEIVDLSLHLMPQPGVQHPGQPLAGAPAGRPALLDMCRDDLRCDVVVYSAEFAGRFFGKYGQSLGLQEMEEAACQQRCRGLFHDPEEVFLLACNTLATKDQDSRTPEEYLQVLLDHDFDRASAERAVELRYGPLGPSFREAIRRTFQGVPRIYGFSSVAPRGEIVAPRLDEYFRRVGDYAGHLRRLTDDTRRNETLLATFRGMALVQIPGLQPGDPAAADRDVVCALYDESRSVADRLRIMSALLARPDFLAFVPTMQIFFSRHPPEDFTGEAREIFEGMQHRDAARQQVMQLVHDLNPSAIKMELAHFALQMEWMTGEEFRTLAVDSARRMLLQPLTSEVVDIECEIAKHETLGDAFDAADLPDRLYGLPEGLRLISCLAPPDPRVTERLVLVMDDPDPVMRTWAAYTLSLRMPLPDPVLWRLAGHLRDDSPDVRARVEWILVSESPLPEPILARVRAVAPDVAGRLPVPDKTRR